MVRCGNCEEEIASESECVRCSSCARKLHFGCTTITARTYRGMSTEQKKSWKCQYCRTRSVADQIPREDRSEDRNETCSSAEVLSADVKKDITEIKETLKEYLRSVEFLSRGYDDMKETINKNNELLHALTGQINDLKEQCKHKDTIISTMQKQINRMEQEIIKNNVEITNVPYTRGENLTEMVTEVAKAVGTEINITDINNIYRINTKQNTKAPKIVVSFTNTLCKEKILHFAKVKGPLLVRNANLKLNFNEISESKKAEILNSKVYLNGQLTAANKELLWQAKTKARTAAWKFVWIRDGKILARKDEGTTVLRIADVDDVNRIA